MESPAAHPRLGGCFLGRRPRRPHRATTARRARIRSASSLFFCAGLLRPPVHSGAPWRPAEATVVFGFDLYPGSDTYCTERQSTYVFSRHSQLPSVCVVESGDIHSPSRCTAFEHRSVAMSPLPTSMRAWSHTVRGNPSRVLTLSTLPVPTLPTPTSVLVRVNYAALSAGGAIMVYFAPFLFRKSPAVPELDFAGSIAQLGGSVTSSHPGLSLGTRVVGSLTVPAHMGGSGALAEYVAIEAENVVPIPDGVPLELAAGVPVSGCTAIEVVKAAQLKRGDAVLVNGASGGVGHIALQLAKLEVGESGRAVSVTSRRNVDLAKSLGADEAVDYELHQPVATYLKQNYANPRFSAVVDAYGLESMYTRSPDYLQPGRPYATVGIAFSSFSWSSLLLSVYKMFKYKLLPTWLGGVPRQFAQVTGVSNRDGINYLLGLVRDGKMKLVVDGGRPIAMEEVPEAFDLMLHKRARGKIIVKIQD
ncbi:hypothetical protein BDY21DRAFT_5568 [Lineolata rhizophorae]|uniref:Enoyl reductase (ER) domain-containing protein n=1 Tax=Lineolata rhizophorae TaxID=578093 RepID=A0A6A6PDE2_9PEZI|nr:hypothetical protein BDY21DRAFT_5568 [Lineolata rhizophorae]